MGQPCSSEESKQSLSPSQWKDKGKHSPSPQVNCDVGLHVDAR